MTAQHYPVALRVGALIVMLSVMPVPGAAQEVPPQVPVQPIPVQPVQPQPVQGAPVQSAPLLPPSIHLPIEPNRLGEPPMPDGVERPYRGLFGGSPIGPEEVGLSMTLNGYGGHDDNLRAVQGGGSGPGIGGAFAGGGLGLDYARPGQQLSMSGNFAADFRRYIPLDDTTNDFKGNFAIDTGSLRTRLTVLQTLEQGSLFRFSDLPGLGDDPGAPTVGDLALSNLRRFVTSTRGTVRHAFNTRTSVYGTGSYLRTFADGTAFDREIRGGGGGLTRQMSTRFTLNVGYEYRESLFGVEPNLRRTVLNSFNLGGGYLWPLTASRRTTLAFSGGTGRFTSESPGTESTSYLRAVGSATFTHLIGRTWTLEALYTRGMRLVDLFPDPMFVDSVRVTFDGMFSNRLEFRTMFAYADGQFQSTGSGPTRTTLSTAARLGYAISEKLELSANYGYYYYDYQDLATLPGELAQLLHRQSFQVNVRYWIPLFVTR